MIQRRIVKGQWDNYDLCSKGWDKGLVLLKHSLPKRLNPYQMAEEALASGWQSVDTVPLNGEGEFLVLTLSGLIRLAKNRRDYRKFRKADGYGPKRLTVNAVESGNYLGAIAWKWLDS